MLFRSRAFWPLPPTFEVEPFISIWSDWLKHTEEAEITFTTKSAAATMRRLEKLGVERAIAAIEHSIAAGWKSIHEPRVHNNGRGKQADEKTKQEKSFDAIEEWLND